MFLVGLDLATVSGVAIGDSRMNHPSNLKTMSFRFRKPHEDHRMAGYNLERKLEEMFDGPLARYPWPDIIVAEAMLALGAQKSEDAAHVALSLHQGVFNFCHGYGVRLEYVSSDRARGAFIGQSRKRRGSNDDMKLLVAEHCHRVGYTDTVLPKFKRDQTDAICVWDWAARTFDRHSPAGVALLGGVA